MQIDKVVLGLGCSFTLVVVGVACAIHQTGVIVEEHCWNAHGDATCEALFDGKRPFCTRDDSPCFVEAEFGCVSEQPVTDECYSPCGGELSALENNNCGDIADESGAENIDSESTDSGSNDSGSTDSESTDSTGEQGCEPACDDPLVCQEGICGECTTHFQCPGEAGCHLRKKTCLPPDMVYHVTTELSFADALEALGDQNGTIRINDALPQSIDETFTFAPDQIVAVVAPDLIHPKITRDDNADSAKFAFQLGSGYLYLWGINLTGNAGVYATGSGNLHAEKVGFDTVNAAVDFSGEKIDLRSCMLISDNNSDPGTLSISGGGSAAITFSTILAREGDMALVCDAGEEMTIRNSIIGSFSANENGLYTTDCPYSIVDTAVKADIASDDFVDATEGDLHLSSQGKDNFAPIADRTNDDPLDDFDSEPREPQGDIRPGADHPD